MEFLSLNLYDTPGLAPRMNVLYWGPGDFPVSYSNRDTSRNAWNRHSGSFMVDMGIIFSNMKYPSHEMLNDILILDQQWLPNQSDFPPISWPWYRAWPSPIMSGFHGAFATGVACQQGTLTLSGHLVPSPISGLANAPIVETKFLELAMSLLDFSPRIPLGTFSILLVTTIYTYIFKEVVYHRGEHYRISKNWNLYIFLQRHALIDIKISIIDICYTNMAPISDTLMFYLLHEWKIQ